MTAKVENRPETAPVPAQAIARLTPLPDVLALLDGVTPVAARETDVAAAEGKVLASDLIAKAMPAQPLALVDGYAVRAEETQDAGGYAPAPLRTRPVRVDAGEAMPAGTDAVAPFDAVAINASGAEALAPVTAGEGVLAKGADCANGAVLRRAGERLRSGDIAALTLAAIKRASLCVPKILVVPIKKNASADAIAALLMREVTRQGGEGKAANSTDINAALNNTLADAVVLVGGTGTGRDDNSVVSLVRHGRVAVHGIAIAPGETCAFGFSEKRPVLVLPGRLDAAIAAWLVVGRPLLARLTGLTVTEATSTATLTRKISSTVGVADIVPVRVTSGKAEPLATKFFPLSALTQANGWLLVPPDSEGFPVGADVAVRDWL